jgi:hypothetical protein
MDLRELGWKVVDWMPLAEDRNQWRFLYEAGIEPSVCIKGGKFLA